MIRVILLASTVALCAAWECTSSLGCQLNGDCVNGMCVCKPAWRGTNCSELALLPTPSDSGIKLESTSTWGGSVIKGTDEKYHMFAAYMEKGCGLTSWTKNSKIVHAVSDTATGKFDIVDTTIPAWSHNPSTALAPDGTILLYHIGTGTGSTFETCNGDKDCCVNGTSPCGFSHCAPPCNCTASEEVASFTLTLHSSRNPAGPWVEETIQLPEGISGNNPSPWFHPNGTLYVVFNSDNMAMVRADTWNGTYTLVTTGACGGGEDPYLWTEADGTWHCLYHRSPFSNLSVAGGHSFSHDGYTWYTSEQAAYSGDYVTYEGTGKYLISKRERPHLIFEAGEPIGLTNGVTIRAPGVDDDHAWFLPNNNPFPGHYDRSWTHLQYVNHTSRTM